MTDNRARRYGQTGVVHQKQSRNSTETVQKQYRNSPETDERCALCTPLDTLRSGLFRKQPFVALVRTLRSANSPSWHLYAPFSFTPSHVISAPRLANTNT
eukprot:970509-Prorocentrum_minimum.AAC.1